MSPPNEGGLQGGPLLEKGGRFESNERLLPFTNFFTPSNAVLSHYFPIDNSGSLLLAYDSVAQSDSGPNALFSIAQTLTPGQDIFRLCLRSRPVSAVELRS